MREHKLSGKEVKPFFGTLRDVPKGFVVCDGENGAPDLKGLFYPKMSKGESFSDVRTHTPGMFYIISLAK